MLPRKNRLPMSLPFQPTLQRRTERFVLKGAKNPLGINRFGIIVSKAIAKRAVARNSVKRAYRACLMTLPPSPAGYDMLFIAKSVKTDPELCDQMTSEVTRMQARLQ
jgi:ribonuclease P protein component